MRSNAFVDDDDPFLRRPNLWKRLTPAYRWCLCLNGASSLLRTSGTFLLMSVMGALLVSACSSVTHPIIGKLKIEMVGYSSAERVTGVAVSQSGRLYVSLMQPGASVSTSIGELNHGVIRPYPIVAWNSLRSGGDQTNELAYAFASVRAIEIDHHNHLWVLNCATDARVGPRTEAAALVEINLNDNKALRIISLDSMGDVCSASINQLHFRSDDLVVFLSAGGNSESRFSLNLQTRACLRGPPQSSTSLDHPCAGEQPQHQETQTVALAADSHAVARTCPNAELWRDSGGRLYTPVLRAPSELPLDRTGARFRLVVQTDRTLWPAGFGRGPDGAFYISALQVCPHPVAQGDVPPSAVFKISSEMLEMIASAH